LATKVGIGEQLEEKIGSWPLLTGSRNNLILCENPHMRAAANDTTVLIEILRVNDTNLADSLNLLRGAWKCTSLLWMQANGFPVLPGLILNGWSDESEAALARFCHDGNLSELLVRIEKPNQRWTRRRGGYTIPVDQVQRQVEELAREGMLTVLLEPASPYADLFSLTTVCDLETGKLDVEIVGPGFDASDVLRSDLIPHERFEVHLGARGRQATSPLQPLRSYVIQPEDYRVSVRQRLEKIGAKLRNRSFPDDLIGATLSGVEREALATEAEEFLRAPGQTMLLDHGEEYQPIPPRLLNMFLREFQRIFERVRTRENHWRILSLAAGFLPQDRLVIWDFFVPGATDTKVLGQL
jgi:hypothetical protein